MVQLGAAGHLGNRPRGIGHHLGGLFLEFKTVPLRFLGHLIPFLSTHSRASAPPIQGLAEHNNVTDRVHVEIAVVRGVKLSGAAVGVIADDSRWAAASYGQPERPADLSLPGRS